jgi:hypothetical protein
MINNIILPLFLIESINQNNKKHLRAKLLLSYASYTSYMSYLSYTSYCLTCLMTNLYFPLVCIFLAVSESR